MARRGGKDGGSRDRVHGVPLRWKGQALQKDRLRGGKEKEG
jgi:hypothetical protein